MIFSFAVFFCDALGSIEAPTSNVRKGSNKKISLRANVFRSCRNHRHRRRDRSFMPMLLNRPHGVLSADDRRVLNGIIYGP
jgi:hypothetical protein